MAPPTVSVVLLARDASGPISDDLTRLAGVLRGTGLTHEILVVSDDEPTRVIVRQRAAYDRSVRFVETTERLDGAAIRRAVSDARGELIVICTSDCPHRMRDVEYAIAMVHSRATDMAIGIADPGWSSDAGRQMSRGRSVRRLTRFILGCGTAETLSEFRVMHANAAKLLYAESKLNSAALHYEILFLAFKYGFRVEYLPMAMLADSAAAQVTCDWSTVRDAIRVRRFNAQQMYRSARRCPVCFSADVFTFDQINGHSVRECHRCRCRYLAEFTSDAEQEKTIDQRVARQLELESEPGERRKRAIAKTLAKRLSEVRKLVPAQSRLLEIGARRGELGRELAREFQYVGIEVSARAARAARASGLEVYCARLADFVNLSGAFDAALLYDVLQHLANPHDGLARIEEHLKPGGYLVIVTPDTESVMSAVSGRRWAAFKIPEHRILYSRSALVELLERSGFEIVSARADYQYVDHERIETALRQWPSMIHAIVRAVLTILPDPLLSSRGSIRIVAKRRSGAPFAVRAIRSVEPTHAR